MGGPPSSAQDLILALNLGILHDRVQGTIWGAGDGTQVSLMQDKHLALYTIFLASSYNILISLRYWMDSCLGESERKKAGECVLMVPRGNLVLHCGKNGRNQEGCSTLKGLWKTVSALVLKAYRIFREFCTYT